jgi:TIR domain
MTAPIGKVFVSHSSSDKGFVDRLVADLASREIPVWYDKFDLRVGDSVTGGINEGLSQSKYFLIVRKRPTLPPSGLRNGVRHEWHLLKRNSGDTAILTESIVASQNTAMRGC